jgi:hypothetical protein
MMVVCCASAGVLFKETAQIFEALLGTLRAAKKRYALRLPSHSHSPPLHRDSSFSLSSDSGLITFPGQMLLSPTDDNKDVTLFAAAVPADGAGHATAAAPAPASAAAAAPAKK